jgi:hypothetical protein
MVASKSPGIQKLVKQRTESAGAVTNAITIDFVFSGAYHATTNNQSFHNMPCIIQQMQIQHDPKQPVVGIALAGKMMAKADNDFVGDQDPAG